MKWDLNSETQRCSDCSPTSAAPGTGLCRSGSALQLTVTVCASDSSGFSSERRWLCTRRLSVCLCVGGWASRGRAAQRVNQEAGPRAPGGMQWARVDLPPQSHGATAGNSGRRKINFKKIYLRNCGVGTSAPYVAATGC